VSPRSAAVVAALIALLAFAPAAFAASYVVNDPGDAPDATPGDGICETATGNGVCTLRAAIQEANASAGVLDTITFTAAPTNIGALNASTTPTSSAITDPVTIDGGSTGTTVTFDPTADGPLLEASAAGVTLERLSFTGGHSGPELLLSGANAKLDHVTVDTAPGVGVRVTGSGAQLGAVTVSKPGGSGISLSGSRATVTNPNVSGSKAEGIAVTGNSAAISGGTVHGNTSNGIGIAAQGVVVNRVVIYGNGGLPIALVPGANGGVQPPGDLRIGPRRADGSLPLTGTTPNGGSVELWGGSPFGPVAPSYLTTFGVGGGTFTYNFPSEPPTGATFAVDLTSGGTSQFSLVTVPSDVVSPDIVRARAVSPTDVIVIPSEPLDANSIQASDFALTMAGKDRQITAVTPSADGSQIDLTSSGWRAGEAGYVQLTGAGDVADRAGNVNLAGTRLRVAAAPGDFVAPIAGQLALSPRNMCLTHGRGCRRTGTTIRFVTTESGKATIVIQRGDKRVGSRIYGAVQAGLNTLKFNGRLSGRKLRAGRYRLLVYVQDLVGNVTDQPPIALLNVRRVGK
jgi:CSLREA domain-containing protein